MSGVHIETGLGVGRKHFGLAIRSENGRSVVVNFGFTLRVLWL